ncbi:MAG: hypothetical protein DHS80DRAFT_25292 [Piptocephalis tieghemiana]|nr:MAG: hypothetical protein DHS80DRAFT_25292 [Piptocephalis tieghemiana]
MSRVVDHPLEEEGEEEGERGRSLSNSPVPSFRTAHSLSSYPRAELPDSERQRSSPPPSSLNHQVSSPAYILSPPLPAHTFSHPPPKPQKRSGRWSWLRSGRSFSRRASEGVVPWYPTYPQEYVPWYGPFSPDIPREAIQSSPPFSPSPSSVQSPSPPMPTALTSSLSSATLISPRVSLLPQTPQSQVPHSQPSPPQASQSHPPSSTPPQLFHPAGTQLTWSVSQPLPNHPVQAYSSTHPSDARPFHSFPSRDRRIGGEARRRTRMTHQPSTQPHPPRVISSFPARAIGGRDGVMSVKEAKQWYRKRLRGTTRRIYWCLEDPIRPPIIPIPAKIRRVLGPRDIQLLQRKYIQEEEGHRREWIQQGLTQSRWTQFQYRYWKAHHDQLPQPCRPLSYRAIQECPPGWTIYYFPDAILLEPTGTPLASRIRRPGPFRDERFLCETCGLTNDTPGWMKLHALTRRDMYPLHPVVHPRSTWVPRGLVCPGVLRMREQLEEAWRVQQASSLREKRRRKEKQGRRRQIERPEERRRRVESTSKVSIPSGTSPTTTATTTTYQGLLRGALMHWGFLRG